MTRQAQATTVLTPTDYFPPELQQLCRTAVRVLHEHVEVGGLCVVCAVSWPCEPIRLADHNLALL
ncbi:hypothetical protein [Protofrankia symbiont of Coriaria ruscifolia]|uniref:hypothetical protein n=1 Tax=Protofrankia symbiont of Coriaria ruscifolia TaxID=1306542 RepID=UPI0010410030|nr:hypothetical protein [Protofrankia symbiont of Coriaria ruscifolia]